MPAPSPLPSKHRPRVSAPLLFVLFSTCLLITVLAAAFPAGSNAAPRTLPELPRGSRIPWQDGSYFLSGVNYPYYRYYGGDIATLSFVDPDCNWTYDNSFNYAGIDADFADMQARGVHVVRWWLFGDGRGAPEFDFNHMVTGFDANFFDHMDQVMQIAAHHNVYIIWSLWDFLMFKPARWLCGPGLSDAYAQAEKLPPPLRDALLAHLKLAQASAPTGGGCMASGGGHSNIVSDTVQGGAQDSFFNNALIPMLQRYANNRNIIGWEIMNEPEWALINNPYTPQEPQVEEPVTIDQMRAFFLRFTQSVHTYAPNQYATVGAASLKFMGFGQFIPAGIWNGLGFDYYGVHYYGWMESDFNNGSPMTIDYNTTQQQLDAPVVIGEFPAYGGSAPVYLPSVRRSQGSRSEAAGSTETSTLSLRYICTAYAPDTSQPPCTRPYTATIEYDNLNGTIALNQTVVLPAYGGWTGLVPQGLGTFSGAARIISNGPVAAAITQTGILSAGEQAAFTGQDLGNSTIWLPRIVNQGTHRSRIAVQSASIHTTTVTITYYDSAGIAAGTSNLTLAAHGSALIDPLLPGSPPGPPAGFQGSAIVVGNRLLVATVYDLDPQLGSDSYNGEGLGYLASTFLPSVRNWGANGTPTLYVQNPCCGPAQDTISYYNSAGALVASQSLSLPTYGSAVVDPQAVLPADFEGTVVITSDQKPAAVMRSVTTSGPVNTTMLYAGTQNPDQRLQFPIVHSLNSDGSGQVTSFSVQNTSASSPITVWVTVNDNSGNSVYSNNAIVVPPQGQWVASTSTLPGVPPGFSGTGEVLWPWPNGWNQGFPLLATTLDRDSTRSTGSTYRAVASHSKNGLVTSYTPEQLMEGIYNKHWAGALAWSYYDLGTGTWDDIAPAMAALDTAHPADVRIGQSLYTPVPTPANGGTATALAATNTPAYGNGQTATAVARLTGTPQPPCTILTNTPTTIALTNTPQTPQPTSTVCSITFSDVLPGSTFYEYVLCLACRGIISGYNDGTFRPNNLLTRGQLSKIVSNAAGYNEPHSGQTFEDVTPASTFYVYIQRLSSRSIINGYPCGGAGEPCLPPGNLPYFRPNANVTRGQTSKIVALAKELLPPPPGQHTFQDVVGGSTFWQWIEALASTGAIGGYPCGSPVEPCIPPDNRPYFRPNNNVTRGQASKIVSITFFPNCTVENSR